MFQRLLESPLRRAWKQFPVVVVTGARQAGKTTLARSFLPRGDYVTLDIPSEAERARLRPAEFFQAYREPVILDEIQYAPTLFRHLKILVDQDRRPGRFLLTGSQSFQLMAGVSESLAGRCAILTLPALGLPEAPNVDVDRFLWRGAYPELWQKPDMDRSLWLGSYLATYLERDVRNLLNVGNLRDFDRFLRIAALRTGQLLSYSDLASDTGISPNTAKSWISVLEASQQIFLLEPYHRHQAKRLVKSPKLYFNDTGLLTYLMGFRTADELPGHALWGAIWENLVISELRKSFLNRGERPPIWLWRTAAGEEIDVLVELAPERFITVECKTAAEVTLSAVKANAALRAEYGADAVVQSFVACRTARAYPLDDTTEAVPLIGRGGLLGRRELYSEQQ
jgi:predicted AAA+ superfamily ATPase